MDHLVFIKPMKEGPQHKITDAELIQLRSCCMLAREFMPAGKTAIYAFSHANESAKAVSEHLKAPLVVEQSRRFETLSRIQIGNTISELFEKAHGRILSSFSTLILMASNQNMGDIVQKYVGQAPVITGVIPLLHPGQVVVYEVEKKRYRVLW